MKIRKPSVFQPTQHTIYLNMTKYVKIDKSLKKNRHVVEYIYIYPKVIGIIEKCVSYTFFFFLNISIFNNFFLSHKMTEKLKKIYHQILKVGKHHKNKYIYVRGKHCVIHSS